MSGQVRSWEELRVLEVGVDSLEHNREGSNVSAQGSFWLLAFLSFTISLLYLGGPESDTTQLQSCFLTVSSWQSISTEFHAWPSSFKTYWVSFYQCSLLFSH